MNEKSKYVSLSHHFFHQLSSQVSTTNSIVFTNGYTDSFEILSHVINEINSNTSNTYVFDLNIMKDLQLRRQYPPPGRISFDTTETILNGTTSPVLSIGSRNSGNLSSKITFID